MILADELIEILESKKEDLKFKNFQEKIINTKLEVVGVKIPELRNLAKQICKKDEDVKFNHQTGKYFECVVLEGFLIAFEKDKKILKEKLENFFIKMDNWAVVDMVVSGMNAFKKSVTIDDFNYFKSLLVSKNKFIVRFGIVCFLKFFSDKKYNDDVIKALETIDCGEYYVDMAIAWLISEIIIKNSQKAIKIMEKVRVINNFNQFIVNKSVQKVCDSYRVSEEIKNELRKMKVK